MFEWIVENIWILWLVLFLALAAIESLTLDLFFLMLSAGALVALITTFLGAPFVLQVVVFCVVSLLMIVLVRPIALKHLKKGPREQRSNMERLIGETAMALEPVTGTSGLVKLGGDTWSAKTVDGSSVQAGERVSVSRIDGATAVVHALRKSDSGSLLP